MSEPPRPAMPYGTSLPAQSSLGGRLPSWLAHEPPQKVLGIQHVYVEVDGQRLPGLLLSRHQVAGGGWEGRVIVPAYDDVDEKWRPREQRVPGESITAR